MKSFLTGGAKVAVAVAVAASFIVIMDSGSDPPRPEKASSSKPKLLARSEFEDLCRIGQQIEVCASRVGGPDQTQRSTMGTDFWYFRGRTYDPITSRRDLSAQVVVENGVVARINFN